MVQHLLGPVSFPVIPSVPVNLESLSVISYNVLLPNSVDGWWNYKMYLPPLAEEQKIWSTWEYRKGLLRERIAAVDPDIVCLQEVSPVSFEDDFSFMAELGYDGKEMFKKGRFRPATFWKTSHCELVAPAVHKDRTLLTSFRLLHSTDKDRQARIFYILNCHLQAGKQAQRRLRQVNEGVRAVLTLARKLKEKEPETRVPLIVCGDFNGGPECGAVRYLEDGFIDETFSEDGDPVTSSRKSLPFAQPFTDVMSTVDRPVPPTMVVSELISTMIKGQAFDKPELSEAVVERLTRLYDTFATLEPPGSTRRVMSLEDVERWLIAINGQLGRGSEFREAARQMGWKDSNGNAIFSETKERIKLPKGGLLSLEGFIQVYQAELNVGKFWGIANDLAVLGEPMPNAGLFQSRYDRMYCSAAVEPVAVMDFTCSIPCPNEMEPSDHLPVAASFILKNN